MTDCGRRGEVPTLANTPGPKLTRPVVVARVAVPAARGRFVAGGPRGRAKTILDALHDVRSAGPYYRDLGATPLLADDSPAYVGGLAVEVASARQARTEFRLAPELLVDGDLLAQIDVDAAAPNDIAATADEKWTIQRARVHFADALAVAATGLEPSVAEGGSALVIRHHPERDEDNTWATWCAALCGVGHMGPGHWAERAPLRGWEPRAVASIADRDLPVPVSYQIYAARNG